MPRGRDEAGNVWELDAQGNPVRLVQPAQASGASTVAPPNPAKLAAQQREQARQVTADARAERSDQRAAAAEARAQKKFESEDTMAPPPGDVSKTGDEYLATLPPSLAGQVKAMAEGRRAFPTGSALRSPAVQQLIAAATQYDPTLDAANAATRVATRKDFTSGKSAQNITAINTALGHFGTLWQASQGLENRSIPAWNALANTAESATGDPRVNRFNLARNAVVNELERVFRGTGGSETDIAQWRSTLHSSMSPDQLRESIAQGIELLNSRLQAIGTQYSQGMGRSSDPMTFLNPHSQAVFGALSHGGSGILPDDKGGPKAPPALGGGGKGPPGGIPKVDYSGMVGKDASLASGDPNNVLAQTYKQVPDNPAAASIAALVRHGRPYRDAVAYAQSHGFNPPSEQEYTAAVAYQKANKQSTPNVDAFRNVSMSFGEKAASSPLAAATAGALAAGTAGLDDVAGRLVGGDEYDANRHALSDLHSTADLVGNVIGGAVGTIAAPELAAKYFPGAMGLAAKVGSKLGRFAPMAGDAAYGATYGASENPDDPLLGAALGGTTAVAGGAVGRGATRGLANVIAPPAGAFGPAYAQGVFPTLGQRFGRSGLAGRMINTTEQAMQSFPGLGALVSRARQIPRDQFQLGAFNEALGDINQRLPANMTPGTDPHSFATQAFGQAYDRARSGMKFAPDGAYLADETAFNTALNNGTLDAAQAAQVRQRIETAVGSRLGSTPKRRAAGALEGDAYKNAASALQQTQRDWAKTDPLKANALNDYLAIFDNAARRNSDPNAVAMLDQADRGYAKLVRIQDAAARVGGDSGTFTPKGFDRAVQKTSGGVRSGPYLRGDALMQDFADAGRGLVDTLPNSGSAERLLTGQAIAGTGGVAVGAPAAIAAHPGALAPFSLYAPGINKLVTRAIAPRSATLSPDIAAALEQMAAQLKDRSALGGKLVLPGAVGWGLQQ